MRLILDGDYGGALCSWSVRLTSPWFVTSMWVKVGNFVVITLMVDIIIRPFSWEGRSRSDGTKFAGVFVRGIMVGAMSHAVEKTYRSQPAPLRIPLSPSDVEFSLGRRTVRLTNLHKVLWPETGFTKRDLLQYY